MSTITSPSRRVLSDKTTNASISIRSPINKLTVSETSYSVLPPPKLSKHQDDSERLRVTNNKTGHKRSREEFEKEIMSNSQVSNDPDLLSQRTELLSDEVSENGGQSFPSPVQFNQSRCTTIASFPPSQDDSEPIDNQFEIREEMSQQTLDKMHAVVFPENDCLPVSVRRPSLTKEISQTSVSLSSLVDFDHSPSQGSDITVPIEQATSLSLSIDQSENVAQKDSLITAAETLRTRLQLALYKVQTNQTSKPFSRLQRPNSAKSSSPMLLPSLTSSSPYSPTAPTFTVRRPGREVPNSPESRIAIARAKATMQPKSIVRDLESIPIPKIIPTVFSSRWNNEMQDADTNSIDSLSENNQPGKFLSSPAATLAAEILDPALLKTQPINPFHRETTNIATPKSRTLKIPFETQTELTSSVVKGEAASGLLELMRATTDSSRTNSSTSRHPMSPGGGTGMCGI